MTNETHSFRLDKWEICQSIVGGKNEHFAIGNVAGHPNHPEQTLIRTSHIDEAHFAKKACIAHTQNSTYVLPYTDARVPFDPNKGGKHVKGFRGMMIVNALAWALLIVGGLFLYQVFSDPAIAETQTTIMYVGIEEGTTLNGRSEPSIESTRAYYFHRGDKLEVIEICENWSRVNAEGVGRSCYSTPDGTCWVASEYLKESMYLSLDVEDDQ